MRPLAVVTGASSGIGRAFAQVLAGDGHDLVLVARRAGRLDALAVDLRSRHGVDAAVVALDLADPAAGAALATRIAGVGRPPAVLVNNAGYYLDGRYLDFPWEQQAAMLQVMLTTPAELVHRLLPAMLEAGRGRVVTIASLGGLLHSTPHETLYGPVKKFAIALSRTLAREYDGSGVTFTAVCPGFTRTEMMDHGRTAVAGTKVPSRMIADAAAVATTSWTAAKEGRLVIVPGAVNKATAGVLNLLPTNLGDRIYTRLFDRLTGLG